MPIAMDDPWYDWLTVRRHGGDPATAANVRARTESFRDRVLDGARLAPGMTLVDVGAGDGLIAFGALSRLGPSLKVILTDISGALLARARQTAQARGMAAQCDFIETSAERMPEIPDASADAVTTRSVLAYLSDKPAAIRELHRILKPGGRVSIAEPIYRDESLRLIALSRVLETRPVDAATREHRLQLRWKGAQLPATMEALAASPLTNYHERNLLGWFESAGFTDLHLELHIDVYRRGPERWESFLATAPRPRTPSLGEVMAERFTAEERAWFEARLRPAVESGEYSYRDTMAYVTAVKPPARDLNAVSDGLQAPFIRGLHPRPA